MRRFLGYANNFFKELFIRRKLIWDLAVRDFRSSYFGSALGISWVFIEPLIFMLIMWFFFTKALKFRPSGNFPYMPWLMTTMTLWNFISAAILSSTSTFSSFAYLMKKWQFNISILPVVALISAMFVHFIFLGILLVIFLLSGIPFSIYWFQIIYYLFASCVFVLGVSWITASLSLFLRDVKNVVGITLQIGYWVSPIFWDLETYPEEYRFYMRLNPLYYVISGYRKSLLYHKPFWDDFTGMAYFWGVAFVMLFVGMLTYKKLRPHFGDVV